MSIEQLTAEAVSLPLADRLTLAQTLWNSLEGGQIDSSEASDIAEAVKRDNELTSGKVIGRTHEQVMQAARLAIG